MTFEQREYIKCATNPLYFLNTYGYVFDGEKSKIDRMTCFTYQEECVEKFHKYQNNIVLKSRQTGLSVITAGYVAWRLVCRDDEKILIIANDGAGAVRFLGHVKQFIQYLPDWLRPDEIKTNNTKRIEFSNGSYAEAKASSPDAGRGDALTLLVLDETAFIKDANAIWMAAGLALSKTQGKCIMISTPNGTGNLYHKTWITADKQIKTPDDFVTTKVHWTQNPFCAKGLEVKTDESGEKYYWSPWYEEQCKKFHYDPVVIAQELDLSFEGSKRLAIENELINKYEKRLLQEDYVPKISYYDWKNDPGKRFVDYKTNFYVWKKPEENKKYLLGVDVARGDGTDFSTIQVIDAENLEQVAEFKDKISPDILAVIVNQVGREYNYAYAVVECNSFGLATALDLNRKLAYKRMFFSKSVTEIYVRPYDFKVDENAIIPGFQTTKKTRPLVINNLRTHLREGGLKIYSERLLAEFRNFIQNKDRPEAEKGFNDDLIFAIAIGLFIRDTEYNNVILTKEMTKNMLDNISFTSQNLSQKSSSEEDKEIGEKKGEDTGVSGIFFGTESSEGLYGAERKDTDDDLSWLYG